MNIRAFSLLVWLAPSLSAGAVAQDAALRREVVENHDWRGFRGSDGRAASDVAVPREWSESENLAWKTFLPGPGTSSPLVVGDRVIVTFWSGYGLSKKSPGRPEDLRRHLLCVERQTGEPIWRRTIEPAKTEDPFGGRMAVHGYASNTPVSDGERIYTFFGKAGVYAFDLDGSELWHADVGGGSSEWKTGSGSSLSLCGDAVLVNASDESHSIRALDKETGKELWSRATPALDQAYGTPLVAGDPEQAVVVLALLGAVWGLAPDSGEPVWTVETKTNGALAPTVVLGDGMLFSFGGQTRVRSHAIRLGGKGDVTDTHVAWSSRYGSYVTTPLFHDGHLYWVNESGIAFCARAKDGELVYQERLDAAFYSSPVRAGDAIYAVSRDAGTFVLPAAPHFEVLAQNRFESDDSSFDGTPALGGKQLFLRSGKFLYCVEGRP